MYYFELFYLFSSGWLAKHLSLSLSLSPTRNSCARAWKIFPTIVTKVMGSLTNSVCVCVCTLRNWKAFSRTRSKSVPIELSCNWDQSSIGFQEKKRNKRRYRHRNKAYVNNLSLGIYMHPHQRTILIHWHRLVKESQSHIHNNGWIRGIILNTSFSRADISLLSGRTHSVSPIRLEYNTISWGVRVLNSPYTFRNSRLIVICSHAVGTTL